MSKNIIFEYGRGNDFVFYTHDFFVLLDERLKESILKTVGTVTINTKRLHRPKIKVEFSSNIQFIAMDESSSVKLEFILTRKSQGFNEVVLGNRLYEITNTKSNFSQSFNFIYNDKNLMEGTHIYFIKTLPILVKSGKVSINNSNISILGCSDFEYGIDIKHKIGDIISFKGKVKDKEKIPGLIEDLLNHPNLNIWKINILKENKDIFYLTGYCSKK